METVEYIQGGSELMDSIAPLWEHLNRLHADLSLHFSNTYPARRFSSRKRELLKKSEQGRLRVDLARLPSGDLIGYCVTTVSRENVGEIDSIFVLDDYRGLGIGEALMRKALAWLDAARVEQKIVVAVSGNERVFPFYAKFGFYPRATTLLQKDDRPD